MAVMEHTFDKAYWETHWQGVERAGPLDPNPYLVAEVATLTPGTALDAGCGEGAEAIWLAEAGWRVTGADISAGALAHAADRAARTGVPGERLRWVEADLGIWAPDERLDLVMTHYAHPAIPQLAFYDRIAAWVAPGGTLLIVGHRHGHDHGDDGPPDEATVTAAAITARLDAERWDIVTAAEPSRTVPGRTAPLHDVVVRATRRR
jgi:SAM-dependent methyltransferase